jgi:hypothetical protein
MDGQRPDETPEEWEQRNAEKRAANPNLGQLHRPLTIAVQNWATPRTGKTTDENPETWAKRQAEGKVATMPLTAQVKAWGTPRSCSAMAATITEEAINKAKSGTDRVNFRGNLETQMMTTGIATPGGKLNPRWVETLMGLPVGWTMPSCASPVIPESTSCASSETASSPRSPSEPL